MVTTTPLLSTRVVRTASASLAVGLMAALGGFDPPAASGGDRVLTAPEPTAAVQRAIDDAMSRQQAAGRSCDDEPALTDTVLYQYAGTSRIVVLTFDETVRQTAARTGWVRGYCS